MNCRFCGAVVALPVIDLGTAPLSNAYLTETTLRQPEVWFPLKVLACEVCWLVQRDEVNEPVQPFDEAYAYFSSYSATWLDHAERFVTSAIARFGLTDGSFVVEVAANDGYLLQYVHAHGIPCLGVEPTTSTAAAARQRGLPIVEAFFGKALAQDLAGRGRRADLMVANNVLAHVPDISDFVGGFEILLAPGGVASFEFPHLLRLIDGNQFDTIYYEHFSYLSLVAVQRVMQANGLSIFDVEEIPTHGGSLRVWVQRLETGRQARSASVDRLLHAERRCGVLTREFYRNFQARAETAKDQLLAFLLEAKRQGKMVAAYGAAAKGNTLLNYAGVRADMISFVVDRNPAKQGKYMPGSRIPIVPEQWLQQERPDFVLILPWNIRREVEQQIGYVRSWGAKFATAIPSLEICA